MISERKIHLKYVKLVLKHLDEIIASGFIIVTTALVLMNVFLRYFMNTGIYWSEEVATMCFVWFVFLGSSVAYRKNAHLGVDLLVKRLPGKLRVVVEIIVDIVLIVINAYIFYLAIKYVGKTYTKPTAVLAISSAYVTSSLIVSFGLSTMHSIKKLFNDVMAAFGKKKEG